MNTRYIYNIIDYHEVKLKPAKLTFAFTVNSLGIFYKQYANLCTKEDMKIFRVPEMAYSLASNIIN